MAEPITSFEFLRPWFLLALLALPLWFWWQRSRRSAGRSWRHSVDAHLLPYLLEPTGGAQRRSWTRWLAPLAATLAILALAGPSLRQTAAPLWQTEAPLVVALDLSAAMRTADLRPTRLAQAKARLKALFELRRGGQIGLLVYAGDAFTVAPITRDAQTLTSLLDSLQPDIMPIEGQRADLGIAHAVQMLQAASYLRGDILLVSDHADAAAMAAARQSVQDGFTVSALGVGTSAGAPLANAKGFVTDTAGKVQLARLDADSLAALATAGSGRYATLAGDGSDLRQLDLLDAHGASAARLADGSADRTLTRSDDGYWLLLPVLALGLGLLRRGVQLAVLLAFCGGLFIPAGDARAEPPAAEEVGAVQAPAAPAVQPGGWASWWQRADQRARQALDAGDAASARALAADPALKASAAYRSEDYEAAAQAWGDLPQADAHYNRGNALARAGKLKEALTAYDEALAAQPQMDDAIANRQAVADALQKQQQQQKQQGGKQDQQDPSGQPGEQQDQQQDGAQQSQQGDPQQGDQSGQPGKDQAQSQDQQQDGQQGQSKDGSAQQDQDGKDGESEGEPGQDEGEAKPQSGPGEKGDDSTEKDTSAAGKQETASDDQQQASDALREQMQQALEQQQQSNGAGQDGAAQDVQQEARQRPLTAEERAELEKSQALQQWLRRVPDDPGGLLRRKFAREYQQRQQRQGDPQ